MSLLTDQRIESLRVESDNRLVEAEERKSSSNIFDFHGNEEQSNTRRILLKNRAYCKSGNCDRMQQISFNQHPIFIATAPLDIGHCIITTESKIELRRQWLSTKNSLSGSENTSGTPKDEKE